MEFLSKDPAVDVQLPSFGSTDEQMPRLGLAAFSPLPEVPQWDGPMLQNIIFTMKLNDLNGRKVGEISPFLGQTQFIPV